jgi:hypothetical protein
MTGQQAPQQQASSKPVQSKAPASAPKSDAVLSKSDHEKFLKMHRDEMFAGHACNKKASEAWDSGDKAGAARIRDEGKAHYKKSDEYAMKVSQSQAMAAQSSSTPSIDLHGYFLDAAMACVTLTVDTLRKSQNPSATVFEVIPGAGTHSDPSKGAKIKPAVLKYFAENNITFEEKNHGSYNVKLPL